MQTPVCTPLFADVLLAKPYWQKGEYIYSSSNCVFMVCFFVGAFSMIVSMLTSCFYIEDLPTISSNKNEMSNDYNSRTQRPQSP